MRSSRSTPESGVAEQLVVVQEVNHHQIAEAELTEIVDAIRTAITEHHEIQAHTLFCWSHCGFPPHPAARSSGSAAGSSSLTARLEAVAEWHAPLPGSHPAAARVASSEHGGRSADGDRGLVGLPARS